MRLHERDPFVDEAIRDLRGRLNEWLNEFDLTMAETLKVLLSVPHAVVAELLEIGIRVERHRDSVAEDSLTLDEPEPEVAAAPLFEPRGAVSWTIPSD